MSKAPAAAEDSDTPPLADLVTRVKERRESMLRVLATVDEGLNTHDLRSRADVPRGSMGHHTDRLVEWGLIVRVGKEPLDRGGSDAWVYDLTERGEHFVDEYLAPDLNSVDDLVERVQSLTDRVETLEAELDAEREARTTAQEILMKHAAGMVEINEEAVRERFSDD